MDTAAQIKATDDFYGCRPNGRIAMEEFGFYCIDEWKKQGHISSERDIADICGFSPLFVGWLPGMAGCNAPFLPAFEEETLESGSDYDIIRDGAGRKVKYFHGRRSGFMPQYLDFPVHSRGDWERLAYRLDENSPLRAARLEKDAAAAAAQQAEGRHMICYIVGGYMYLRSLVGGEQLLYMFYDEPELVHSMMEKWLALAEFVTAGHIAAGNRVDSLLLDEDICYNHGALISPDMMRQFLFPYYRRLFESVERRGGRKPIINLATDGDCRGVIPLYGELGVNMFSPMEVASGCDVVEIGRRYPTLLMKGGFDKRILAAGKREIDAEVERIMPVMKARGGYVPTCDHGVPPEVPFENYVYFRKRLKEYE